MTAKLPEGRGPGMVRSRLSKKDVRIGIEGWEKDGANRLRQEPQPSLQG